MHLTGSIPSRQADSASRSERKARNSGPLAKPSSGLEPETRSLPWNVARCRPFAADCQRLQPRAP
jgi:hypothetical protein